MYRTSSVLGSEKIAFGNSKRKYSLVVLGFIYIVGVLCGAMIIATVNTEFIDTLVAIVRGFAQQRIEQSAMLTFKSAFYTNAVILAAIVIFAFSAIGAPFISGILWSKGLGFGLWACFVFINYGYRAYGYLLLIMFPPSIAFAIIFILASRDGVAMSLDIYELVFSKKHTQVSNKVPVYLTRFGVCLAAILLTAVLEAVLYSTFGELYMI